MQNILPIFQYPTTTVWVDDDKNFLELLEQTFKDLHYKKMFSSSDECLAFFDTYKKSFLENTFLYGERDHETYGLLAHSPVDFDVTDIAKLRNNSKRMQEVSVLVCDYAMPKTSGSELCKMLNVPTKKILLTSVAKDNDAVTAFNNGIIDRFIHKSAANLKSELQSYIKILTRKYFIEKTKGILSHLEADGVLPLTDTVFAEFFDKWCEENNIEEFYLIDKHGSFLTINNKNEARYFIAHTDKSLDEFVEIYLGDPKTDALIQSVSKRQQIPFFGYDKEPCDVDVAKWANNFYKPEILLGREKYYVFQRDTNIRNV